MAWSTEISQLVTETQQFIDAVELNKPVLDAAANTAVQNAASALTSATEAIVIAAASTTSADVSKGHAVATEAIANLTKMQQDAVSDSERQASLAAGYALSAVSIVQQDLSGVTAAALHRSPNAVTSMFIYDTSKDSDGGAWTEKCQHTSWYNETLSGNWLGAHPSELSARYENATLGAELITNNDFNNGITGWTTTFSSTATVSAGVATFNGASATYPSLVSSGFAATIGKLYRVRIRCKVVSGVSAYTAIGSSAGFAANAVLGNLISITNDFVEYTFFAAATATTMYAGIFFNTSPAAGIVQVDSVSVREVGAMTTPSNDYFQLTTDGKFYRLWKNLIQRSEEFDNTAWEIENDTLSANTTETTAPDGTNAAEKMSELTNTNNHFIRRRIAINGTIGAVYTLSVYVKKGTRDFFSISDDGSRRSWFNIASGTAGTVNAGHTAAITSVGNNWYRCSITFTAISATFQPYFFTNTANNQAAYTGSTSDYTYIWGAQLEFSSTATSYEPKTTLGSTSEVFRGNKRDFPRLAGIVCESIFPSHNSLTIYDLTEPGRPMWFHAYRNNSATTSDYFFAYDQTVSSVYAINGKIYSTLSSGGFNNGGIRFFDFAEDKIGVYGYNTNYNGIKSPLTSWSTQGFLDRTLQVLTGPTYGGMSATVLNDAPVSITTGLQIPTVGVVQNGAAVIIKDNGSVVKNTGDLAVMTDIAFQSGYAIVKSNSYPGLYVSNNKVRDLANNFTYTIITGEFGSNNGGLIESSNRAIGYNNGSILRNITLNRKLPTASLSSKISNTFNTGYMPGDIRRAYLSDIDVGSVTGPELVTNGTFDSNLDGWTASVGATLSRVDNRLQIFGNGAAFEAQAYTTLTLVPGKSYRIDVTTFTASGKLMRVGTTIGLDQTFASGQLPLGQASYIFRATATTQYLTVLTTTGGTQQFDNISVREAVVDRSYKAQGAPVTGTLTKTQLASGTSLVGYSGWSTTNYLREPYSADLDFGTGEFSASAWINFKPTRVNLLLKTEELSSTPSWTLTGVTTSLPGISVPYVMTEIKENLSSGQHKATNGSYGVPPIPSTISFVIKANGRTKVYVGQYDGLAQQEIVDLVAGTITNNTGYYSNRSVTPLGDGFYLVKFTSAIAAWGSFTISLSNGSTDTYVGDGVSGVYVGALQMEAGSVATPYQRVNTATDYTGANTVVFDRSSNSGSYFRLGTSLDKLTATAFDGTTTRTVTTTATYSSAQWLKAEANYTTDGSLAIRVNGREVAVTRGNPLLTLNNTSAVLTIGNSFTLDAPFLGSIALLKLGATVPTPEQSTFMYEQEKQLFRANAVSVLPDSGSVVDMSYDDATDRWVTVSSTNESYWSGLVRTSVTPVPAGSYSKIATTSGIELAARTTTNPGVDVTIPAYVLREELVKRSEPANKLNRQIAVYDYIGGFTGNITTGSTAIASVTNLTYPVSLVGARISGTGIPANTTITAVSGTTIYISAAATATTTGLVISFLDFNLPVGFETESVTSAGVVKQEGATKDYTRLFDGFIETIRFAVAPGATTWVRIQATKSI